MDKIEKSRVNQEINTEARPQAGTISNKHHVEKSDTDFIENIIENIKTNTDLPKTFEMIKQSHYLFSKNITSQLTDYIKAEKKEKEKANLLKAMKKGYYTAKAYMLISDDTKDAKQTMLKKATAEEKHYLAEAFVKAYQDNALSFKMLNKVYLAPLGKKLHRTVVAQATLDKKVMVHQKDNPIIRAVAAGKFQKKDTFAFSDEYKDFKNSTQKKIDNPQYNLINKSAMFGVAKNSKNLQAIMPGIENFLAENGVPEKLAQNMNYYEFYDLISGKKKKTTINFNEFGKPKNLTPYQEFCKQTVENKEVFNSIIDDMEENGISKEYIRLWKKSMTENYNHNPDTSSIPDDCKKPAKMSIHHKTKIQFAAQFDDPLMINDGSNFTLIAEYDDADNTHDALHEGDNKKTVIYAPEERTKVKDEYTHNIRAGQVILQENIVDLDGNTGIDPNTVFLSKSKRINSDDFQGCLDFYNGPTIEPDKTNKKPTKQRA